MITITNICNITNNQKYTCHLILSINSKLSSSIIMNRWLAMYARSIVATLDFNANVNRPTKTVEGKEVFKLKVK